MSKNFSQIENLMPLKDTLANLQARPRISGVSYYATDTNKNYSDDGVDLVEIGSGGIGSPAIYLLLNADNDKVTDWTNTGSGVFILDTVNPINGSKSYKFTAAVQNDAVSRLVTPVFRNKGKENSVSLQYTLDILGIECQIFDTATSTIIEQIPLTVETASKTLNLPFILKDTSTTVELRFINTHATNTPTIKFDDISFSDDPFVYKNLLLENNSEYNGYTSVNALRYVLLPNKLSTSNDGEIVISLNTDHTRFTFNKKSTFTATANFSGAINLVAYVRHFNSAGTLVGNSRSLTGSIGFTSTHYTGKSNIGDYLVYYMNNTPTGMSGTANSFSVFAQAESEHVITPVKSNSFTGSYVPVIGGFTSSAPINVQYSRVGEYLEVTGTFDTSAVLAAPMSVSLPVINGVQLNFNQSRLNDFDTPVGSWTQSGTGPSAIIFRDAVFSGKAFVDSATSTSTIFLTDLTGGYGAAVFLKRNGVTVANPGTRIGFTFKVPIQGWTSDVSILGAIPSRRVAYIKDVKGVGVSGGTATAGLQTRVLNTVEGDTSIVTLNGVNQFKPIKGRFSIEVIAPVFRVDSSIAYLYSLASGLNVLIGSVVFSWSVDNNTSESKIFGEIISDGIGLYEVRHYVATTIGANGFGATTPIAAGVSSVYTQVKLEKLD